MRKKYSKRRYKRKKRYGRGLLGQDKWSRYYTKQKGRDIFGAVNSMVGLLAKVISK